MAVTEGLARGVPAVVGRGTGAEEALGRAPDGAVPGAAVPPGDPDALAATRCATSSDRAASGPPQPRAPAGPPSRAGRTRPATSWRRCCDRVERVPRAGCARAADRGRLARPARGGGRPRAGTPPPPCCCRRCWSGSTAPPAGPAGRHNGRGDGHGLRVVDLGAGTGANVRWLAPRLPHPERQHWTLVDHDPALLARGPVDATALRADVTDLAQVLTEIGGADLVTAAALLDLLDGVQVRAIVDAVVDARLPALFALSVDGGVSLDPEDPDDVPVAEAFDAHQRRGDRLGARRHALHGRPLPAARVAGARGADAVAAGPAGRRRGARRDLARGPGGGRGRGAARASGPTRRRGWPGAGRCWPTACPARSSGTWTCWRCPEPPRRAHSGSLSTVVLSDGVNSRR